MKSGLFFAYLRIAYSMRDFLRRVHYKIMRLFKPSTLNVHGMKMLLDYGDTSDYSKGYEPETTKLIKEQIKEGDTIIDLGACIGYYTLLFSKLVGENGKVFAFEPEPKNFAILKKNIELNNLKNVILINKAVSDKTGKSNFYVNRYSIGSHHLQNEFDNRSDKTEVETVTLDRFFSDYGRKIDLIKMDIEGSEVKALKGARQLIKKNKNIKIIMEFSEIGVKDMGLTPNEYLSEIKKFGFKIKQIKDDRIINLLCTKN